MTEKNGILTYEQMKSIFDENFAIQENMIFHCKCCKYRNLYNHFEIFQVKSKEKNEAVYICKKRCIDKKKKEFILEKNIDPRFLRKEHMVDIEKSYLLGEIKQEYEQ